MTGAPYDKNIAVAQCCRVIVAAPSTEMLQMFLAAIFVVGLFSGEGNCIYLFQSSELLLTAPS